MANLSDFEGGIVFHYSGNNLRDSINSRELPIPAAKLVYESWNQLGYPAYKLRLYEMLNFAKYERRLL